MMQTNDFRPNIQVDQRIFFRALGTTYKVLSKSVNGSAAIVEHTVESKSIGAPMHKHTHEDEISYVLEGELSVIQGGKEQTAGPGEYIIKPRGIFHTFWNAGNERIRFIEVITPGNFEYYFAELAAFLETGKPPQIDKVRETGAKYGLIVDPTGAEDIIKKYGLNPPG
jgi:quercetin dioxygenase-like cupin family protein